MSIRSSITRSQDDNLPLSRKSYRDIKLKVDIVDAKTLIDEDPKENMRTRLYDREFKVDRVKDIFKISSRDGQNITVNQIKDIFDDIGFNTDTTISDVFGSDIMMVYNIGGFLIPFWYQFVDLFFKKSQYRNFMLTKFSFGKKRLHCRIYEGPDGNWYITSHVDAANWLNFINPFEVVKSHLEKGTGDYTLGTQLLDLALKEVQVRMKRSQRIFVDIQHIYNEVKNGNI